MGRDISRWHGNRYRFIQHYRSDRPDAIQPEFDAPFARLDWIAPRLFNVAWHRHTGEWRILFERVTLEQALQLSRSCRLVGRKLAGGVIS